MGALSNLATVGLNFALAQQAARQDSSDINRERDRQIREIQAQNEEQRRRQQEALRRRLATQRARAGAAGVGGGGSAQAVLRGLTEEAEATQGADDEQSARRIADLRRRASQARERNLLELVGGATRSTLGLLGGSSRSSLLDF
jgi:NaMN:DMB phosphoribosyltransferase